MEASKRSKIFSPATYTGAGSSGACGAFQGFLSPASQTVFINGPFCYMRNGITQFNHLGRTYAGTGYTMTAPAGMQVPVNCNYILPSSSDVLGFLA